MNETKGNTSIRKRERERVNFLTVTIIIVPQNLIVHSIEWRSTCRHSIECSDYYLY